MPNSAHSSWNLSSSGALFWVSTAGLYLGTGGGAIKDRSLRRFGRLDGGRRGRCRGGGEIGSLGQAGPESRRQIRLDVVGHIPDQRKCGARLDDSRNRLGPKISKKQVG